MIKERISINAKLYSILTECELTIRKNQIPVEEIHKIKYYLANAQKETHLTSKIYEASKLKIQKYNVLYIKQYLDMLPSTRESHSISSRSINGIRAAFTNRVFNYLDTFENFTDYLIIRYIINNNFEHYLMNKIGVPAITKQTLFR